MSGETVSDAVELRPDFSLIVDPEQRWPDPMQCPVWPFLPERHAGHNPVPGSRHDAETELRALSRQLHGDGPLRVPSSAEIAAVIGEHFEPRSPRALGWQAELADMLGGPFSGLAPRSLSRAAVRLMTACHLRGYLRRLDHEEAAQAALQRERAKVPAQLALGAWEARQHELVKVIEANAEGRRRHVQRVADQKAASRFGAARTELAEEWSRACRAAERLGLPTPERPACLGA